MDRRCRAGQIEYFVNLDVKREGDIVPHKFKMRLPDQVRDIVLGAAVEVINTKHVIAFCKQSFAKVGPQKACPSSDKHPFSVGYFHLAFLKDLKSSQSIDSGFGPGIPKHCDTSIPFLARLIFAKFCHFGDTAAGGLQALERYAPLIREARAGLCGCMLFPDDGEDRGDFGGISIAPDETIFDRQRFALVILRALRKRRQAAP
jgi:hypothetical protein